MKNKLMMDRLRLEAIPILSRICEEGNPSEFMKWGGNLCAQSAFFVAIFLRDEMDIPIRDIYVCESTYKGFNNSARQEWQTWTHAWVYAVINNQGYTLDQNGILGLSINKADSHELSFDKNPYLMKVRELDREDFHNWELMTGAIEFYTDATFNELYKKIIKEMNYER